MDMPPLTKLVYAILRLKSQGEPIGIAKAEIAKQLRCSDKAVLHALRRLEGKGLLIVSPQKHGPNEYKVL